MSKESRFRRAQALVLTAVRHNGPLSSETLTAMCINNGLIDISQAGAIFQTLRSKGLIEPWSKFKRSNRKAYGTMWGAPNHYPVLYLDGIESDWKCKGCTFEYIEKSSGYVI